MTSIRPRVAVTRSALPGTGVAALAAVADVVEWPHDAPPTPGQLRELVAGCDAVLALGTDVFDAATLDAAGGVLTVVALASMGHDALQLDALAARGVVGTHTPSVLAETTADLTMALILMARRRLRAAAAFLDAGRWTTFRMDGLLGLDVHGARLGLLGYGQIGQAMARRASGFAMPVQHHDPARPGDDGRSVAVPFDQLIETSDIISVHVPLTSQTRGLIGPQVLGRMKPTATLVNTARGGVVDEPALLEALRSGRLHSAGLDVMEREPRSDPADPLLAEPHLVVLPHVGSATEATRAAMVGLAADNILAVLAGQDALTPVPGGAVRPGTRPGSPA
jgi:lactate dehydrogenase-like 2-hydroxyacid dehydrogenase